MIDDLLRVFIIVVCEFYELECVGGGRGAWHFGYGWVLLVCKGFRVYIW